jgi:DUF1680 family protein
MEKERFSKSLPLQDVRAVDEFWSREQELVRREVIPYQWEALNDRVEGATPSFCMRNFKTAGKIQREKKRLGEAYQAPTYAYRGFEALPDDPKQLRDDRFYGFVFQDSDFSKWIEAVGYTLVWHPDPVLERIADEAIDIVCEAQCEDGYLDTYYIINGLDGIFTNLKDHHELYCLGHFIEGAVSYYEATGKDKLLGAAKRYADFVISRFGPEEGKCQGYPGHEIAEMALVRLYQVTGEERYLELSRFFLDRRGTQPYYFDEEQRKLAEKDGKAFRPDPGHFTYHQAHLPVREQREAVGHAVRAVYLYSGMADVARLTGDEEMFTACQSLWESITREKLYLTGGIGGTHMGEAFSFPYDLPNDTAYSETCAAIGLVFFARRMLELSPKSVYGDVMEQALYNGVLSGMALDGKSFFYVNPLEVVPRACRDDARKAHVKPSRQKWFGCACCPPNIARLVSSLMAYAYTENEDTLWLHLYIGSTLTKRVGEKKLELTVNTDFPWDGSGEVAIHAEEPVECTLAFRIPGWCQEGRIYYENGKDRDLVMGGHNTSGTLFMGKGREIDVVPEEYERYARSLEKRFGKTIAAELLKGRGAADKSASADSSPHVKTHFIKDGYIYIRRQWQDGDRLVFDFPMEVMAVEANPKVREDIGKVAFTRGPIVYCLEEVDNGDNLHLCQVEERILHSGKGIEVAENHALGHRINMLLVPGVRMLPEETETTLYRKVTEAKERSVTLRLVPYYAWNNRGEGEMSVWIRQKASAQETSVTRLKV